MDGAQSFGVCEITKKYPFLVRKAFVFVADCYLEGFPT